MKPFFLATAVILSILLISCSGGTGRTAGSKTSETNLAVEQMSALEQMELAFDGGYTKSQIKVRLDDAMRLYRLPISEENYSRAGSSLVSLRREFGIEEMDILSYMIRSHVPGANLSFPGAAGIATAALKSGDR